MDVAAGHSRYPALATPGLLSRAGEQEPIGRPPGRETLALSNRMRFWWVNQNQTYRHEVRGGYLWSPKRKKNGAINPFYETMREVSPGDLVFSFANSRIGAYGIARSHAYEAPQPDEFGSAGRNWERIGWRIDVRFHELLVSFRPADWIEALRPLLPAKYAPLLPNGHGVQSIYLAELARPLALVLADLCSTEVAALARAERIAEEFPIASRTESALWEEHLRSDIERNTDISQTEKEAIVLSRRGQGLFRDRVQQIESRCRITHVDRTEHLRASHCKPWRDASNSERLDGENGLLLTPSIDHLFDRGFIAFCGDGRLLISPVAHKQSLERMGVPTHREVNVGGFTRGQQHFLEFHRDQVFLEARRAGERKS